MRRRLHSLFPVLACAASICAASLTWASAASAHAQLLGTTPAADATVARQPPEVIFKFNQNVGGTLGAVRVYDAQGNEVDDLDVSHPQGQEHWMGVGLKRGLPDGTYTATYRVVSADTHIVYGGVVFNIGHPGAAPKFTVAGLIGRGKSGKVTEVAFGVVRGLDYLTIALLVGGLAFLTFAWLPALNAIAGAEPEWLAAAQAFTARIRRILIFAVMLGVTVSVLGILLQGASAAGVSLWGSLKSSVLQNTMESRFGKVWGARALDWMILGGLLPALFAARRNSPNAGGSPAAVLDAATLDAAAADASALDATALDKAALDPTAPDTTTPDATALNVTALAAAAPRWLLAAIGVAGAYLVVTPALGGHASVQSPTVVFFPSDVLHVLGASVWVGGIACLLLALPYATRQLEPTQRTRVLLATLARFSPMALLSVIAIAITGVVQAYIDVRSIHGLLHTTYGALILVKSVLLLTLIGFGWINRQRVIPALQRLQHAAHTPGAVGALARRTMRGELALMMCVFGVTAALIGYAPPIDAASGPFSANTTIGPALLEMTVEPARVGLNTIHLYLINAKTGAQFTATKELVAKAELPAKGIGPLPLTVNAAGPGHYILSSADLSPSGTWEVQITDRISEFEENIRSVKVPIG